MNRFDRVAGLLGRVNPRLLTWVFEQGRRVPAIRRRVEAEYDKLLDSAEAAAPEPSIERFVELPEQGRPRAAVLDWVEASSRAERPRWEAGRVSGAVYHGDAEHIDFLNRVYALTSQANPLHSDVWPSLRKFEAEIVAMTAAMLGGADAGAGGRVCGTVTSGGTESIMLAVKAYRDRARAERHVRRPEMVLPTTAHVAFDKAAACFGVKAVRVEVGADFRANVDATAHAVNKHTILLVGSAPAFPHGTIDPIAALSDLALRYRAGLHVDACLGGFVLPWARELGYPVPDFDFRLPGVTSISVDTHKYGYAAKGTSVILYRDYELRRYQYSVATDWPGGLYFSPTLAGSRPGGLSAAAWAAMVSIGAAGYRDKTRRILETAARIRAGVEAIDGLEVLGDPLWVIAFRARQREPEGRRLVGRRRAGRRHGDAEFDIYRVLDAMSARGWSLNGLHRPASVHLCVTLRHAEPGVAEQFLDDLRAAVADARSDAAHSDAGDGVDRAAETARLAPIYGLGGTLPLRGAVAELLRRYLDRLYEP